MNKIEQAASLAVLLSKTMTGRMFNASRVSADVRKLMRLSVSHLHLAELDCNQGLTEKQQKRIYSIERAILGVCREYGIPGAHFSGDPRGYTVRLDFGPSSPSNNLGGHWGI